MIASNRPGRQDRPTRVAACQVPPIPFGLAARRLGCHSYGCAAPGIGSTTLTHPDEAMLARLRSARRIDLYHPASRAGDEIHAIWRGYLSQQWWRHLLWFSFNGVVSVPTIVILWILPGPNLIGYWFAYRAIHHAAGSLGDSPGVAGRDPDRAARGRRP